MYCKPPLVDTEREVELRRHAIQLAAMLPDDPAEARMVIRLMRQLLTEFVLSPAPKREPARMLRIVAD
jgi:hypothetical protein